jgi:peptidoglycan hydrolase-like amidase
MTHVIHKTSSINYLLNRMHSYPITKEGKEIELNTIRNQLLNNRYNINECNKRPKKRTTHIDTQQQKTKRATFTYSGKEVRKITKHFGDTRMKIAFRTTNTIQNILRR